MWVLGSNIADMDCTYWTCGQCCVFRMWVLGSNIVKGLYDRSAVRTGHVVSAVCSVCGCWGGVLEYSGLILGLYVLDMWSVLCVPYVGGGGV